MHGIYFFQFLIKVYVYPTTKFFAICTKGGNFVTPCLFLCARKPFQNEFYSEGKTFFSLSLPGPSIEIRAKLKLTEALPPKGYLHHLNRPILFLSLPLYSFNLSCFMLKLF